jgi:hypothetical protein
VLQQHIPSRKSRIIAQVVNDGGGGGAGGQYTLVISAISNVRRLQVVLLIDWYVLLIGCRCMTMPTCTISTYLMPPLFVPLAPYLHT